MAKVTKAGNKFSGMVNRRLRPLDRRSNKMSAVMNKAYNLTK